MDSPGYIGDDGYHFDDFDDWLEQRPAGRLALSHSKAQRPYRRDCKNNQIVTKTSNHSKRYYPGWTDDDGQPIPTLPELKHRAQRLIKKIEDHECGEADD